MSAGHDDIVLKIDGEVENPCSLTFRELREIDTAHQIWDVSELVPTREGGAIRLEGLLRLAKATPRTRFLGLHSDFDDFHASIPLAQVRDRAFLIYCLEEQPLPRSKGGPLRFFIPDHASCKMAEIDECANVKFVDHIEFTAERGLDNRPQDDEQHAKLHAKQS